MLEAVVLFFLCSKLRDGLLAKGWKSVWWMQILLVLTYFVGAMVIGIPYSFFVGAREGPEAVTGFLFGAYLLAVVGAAIFLVTFFLVAADMPKDSLGPHLSPSGPKHSRLGLASIWVFGWSLLFGFVAGGLSNKYRLYGFVDENGFFYADSLLYSGVFVAVIGIVFAGILGVAGLVRKNRKKFFAWFGMATIVIFFVVALGLDESGSAPVSDEPAADETSEVFR